jgi:5-methylcytosine-specific restriction enzyme A
MLGRRSASTYPEARLNMPSRLRTPCPVPGCGELTDGGRCEEHKRQANKQRGGSTARGYGQRHENRFRKGVLERDINCTLCITQGKWVTAVIADHYPLTRRELVEQGLDPDDPSRGRGLCKPCHDKWTAESSPGGFNAEH